MTEPLPILVENSLQIAWDFLDASGEIDDPQQTAEVLLGAIKTLVLSGEHREQHPEEEDPAEEDQHRPHDLTEGPARCDNHVRS